MIDYARLIRMGRLRLCLSQTELARRTEISLPTLQNIESRKANPGFEMIVRLLEEVGLTFEVTPKKANWDFLIECGVPLLSDTPQPTTSIISKQNLVTAVLDACLELSTHSKDAETERKHDALVALIVAIKQHYPSFFKKNFNRSLVQKYAPQVLSPRIIKLKRMALARVSQYL